MSEKIGKQTTGYGITEEDMARIEAYLQKESYKRTLDDLRPPAEG